jgi:eukaryotic-like serine/threonine-protein kinase
VHIRPRERYDFEEQIGEGATGTVFRVWDRKTERRVALKLLTEVSAPSLVRFKEEFRNLAQVRHPNVVRIFELTSVDDLWFYTMELIDGQELMEYLALQEIEGSLGPRPTFEQIRTRRWDSIYRTRTSPDTVIISAAEGWSMLSRRYLRNLRIALRQLASGIRAIHDVGFVHRDVKPGNVVVTDDGRVVLLDFGLARPIDAGSRGGDELSSFAGTPGYMSPEQASRLPLNEASDWYSLGIILYQALTGTLPFTGSLFDIIVAQQSEEIRPPSELVPDTPKDLDELCMGLLQRLPEMRPSGEEILEVLGGEAFSYWIPDFRPEGLKRGSRFVGREPELETLHDCLAEAISTRSMKTVEVRGASGSGKTVLLNQFCDEARLVKDLLVLYGRCFSAATVPYNAFDQIFDGIARHTAAIPVAELPPVPALLRRFPVFERDDGFREEERTEGSIHQETLRMLEFLARERSLIVVIDDAQRSDEESLVLLESLVKDPGSGRILLVVVHSHEGRGHRLQEILEGNQSAVVDLGALGLDELRQWARSFFPIDRVPDDDTLVGILQDTGGDASLTEQVLHAVAHDGAPADTHVSLIFERKLERLPASATRLLHVLAEALQPLEPRVALEGAGLDPKDDYPLILLRAERLARSRFVGDDERVEIYHDTIRDWIRGRRSVGGE